MQHFSSLQEASFETACLTIGAFDGFHRGHQTLIQNLVNDAAAIGSHPVVLTFFPHPAVVLRKLQDPFYLNTPEERAELLSKTGIDALITQPFDLDLAAMGAFEFMQLLVNRLGLKRLWVGHDFALGRNREGSIDRLRAIGVELGYTLEIVQPVAVDGEIISSSLIRKHISGGRIAEANRLLGRPYTVNGTIVPGDRRGRSLGFPTANLAHWPQKLLPANGIYATWAVIHNGSGAAPVRLPSVTSIGYRPTFETQITAPRVETFILDFDEDIYGRKLEVCFIEYLRPELRFDSIEALIHQMDQDVIQSREVLHVS